MTHLILKIVGYGTATVLALVLGAGMVLRGLDERRMESIVSTNARGNMLSGGKNIIGIIKEYKADPSVRLFKTLGFLDFLALDAVLCQEYFDVRDIENAIASCTDAIEAGRMRGVDVSLLIYNRGMASVRGAFALRGAFSNAEADLKIVPDTGSARAYIEEIETLRARQKAQPSKKKEGGTPPSRGLESPLESKGKDGGENPGY